MVKVNKPACFSTCLLLLSRLQQLRPPAFLFLPSLQLLRLACFQAYPSAKLCTNAKRQTPLISPSLSFSVDRYKPTKRSKRKSNRVKKSEYLQEKIARNQLNKPINFSYGAQTKSINHFYHLGIFASTHGNTCWSLHSKSEFKCSPRWSFC